MSTSPVQLTINATVQGLQSVQSLSQALQQLGVSANALSASSLGNALASLAGSSNTAKTALNGLLPALDAVAHGYHNVGIQSTATTIAAVGTYAAKAAGQVSSLSTSLGQAGSAGGGIGGIASGLGDISSGAQSAGSSMLGLATRVGGVALAYKVLESAARAAFNFIKEGVNANAEQESSRLGIASLVASLTTVKDAQGQVLKGSDALNASFGIADEQLKKLRVAGLETAATYEQLVSAYQEAIGAGSAAGLNLDQVRKLTIGVTQAAAALNMPMWQVNQEIRAILQGQIDHNARVGQALGLTSEELKLWKQKGTLYDELAKKLEIFNVAGEKAATTWKAALSNFEDALQILAGDSTQGMFRELKDGLNEALKGLFDLKDASIDKTLQPLVSELDKVNTAVGKELAEGVRNVVAGIKEFSAWIHENQAAVDGVTQSFGFVWDELKKIFGLAGELVGTIFDTSVKSGLIETVFRSIAVVMALTVDSARLLGSAIVTAGGYVVSALAAPLSKVLGLVKEMLNLIPGTAALGDRLIGKGDQANVLNKVGDQAKAAFTNRLNELKSGNSEVQRLINSMNTQITAAAPQPPKRIASGATSTAKPVADTKKKGRGSHESADADFKADLAAERTELQAHYEVLKADLDKSLEERQISQKEYIEKQKELELQKLEDQRKNLEKEKSQAEAAIAKPGITPAEHQRLLNDVKRINAEIKATLDKEDVVKIRAEIDQDKLTETITKLRASLSAEELGLQGKTLEAKKTQINEKLRERLDDPNIKGNADLVAKANNIAKLETQQAEFEDLKTQADRTLQDAKDKIADLQREQKEGLLTGQQVAEQTKQINAEAAASIKKQIDAMKEANTGNEKLVKELDRLQQKYKDLAVQTSEFGKLVGDSLGKGITDGLKAMMDGGKFDIGRFLKGVLLNVATAMEQDSAKKLGDAISKGVQEAIGGDTNSLTDMISNFFKKIFSGITGGSGGGGIGSMISSLFSGGGSEFPSASAAAGAASSGGFFSSIASWLGFAEGGIVDGPGTETSDSIPTKLSKGEGILTAKAVKMIGPDMVHALNAKAKGYATGGIIGGANSTGALPALMAGQAQAPQVSVHLTNSLDPTDMLKNADSAVFNKMVVAAVNAHPTAFRQALG